MFVPGKQKKEIFDIIDRGGNILEYFSHIDPLCKDIRKDGPEPKIILGEKLGSGVTGTAYKADISSFFKDLSPTWSNRLVVKEINIPMVNIKDTSPRKSSSMTAAGAKTESDSDSSFLTPLEATPKELSPKKLKSLAKKFYGSTGSTSAILALPGVITTPCNISSYRVTYGNFAAPGKMIYPGKKDLFCAEELTEFLVSLWVGNFYTSGKCINFIETFYFAICSSYDRKMAQYYTFMEQIDRDFTYILKAGYPEEIYNNIYIQILFAVAMYQHNGNIVHGDLHGGNVFLLKHGKSLGWNENTEFNGENIGSTLKSGNGADYMEYRYGTKSFYVPTYKTSDNSQFIVKIGDWGRGVKYSSPMIGSKDVILNNYPVPNWYNKAFDLLTITRYTQYFKCPSAMIRKIAAWMEGTKDDYDSIMAGMKKTQYMNYPQVVRTNALEDKYDHVTPEAILMNEEFMKDFLVSPPAGSKIVLVGEIKDVPKQSPKKVVKPVSPKNPANQPSPIKQKEEIMINHIVLFHFVKHIGGTLLGRHPSDTIDDKWIVLLDGIYYDENGPLLDPGLVGRYLSKITIENRPDVKMREEIFKTSLNEGTNVSKIIKQKYGKLLDAWHSTKPPTPD